jgi:uncharacterized protein YyaL (SSP411 family)
MIKAARIIFVCICLFAIVPLTKAEGNKKNAVEWLTPEEMYSRYTLNKKPILVDVYTNWCHYCKVMDKTTWANDSVIAYVNEHFYMVKINAESTTPYQWMGTQFEYNKQYKVNMLAVKLLGGQMSYPSTVVLPVKGNPELVQGAFTAKELEMLLKYYGDTFNERTNPEQFQKIFKGNWH